MLYLILITFFVFLVFWIGDLVLTIKTVKYLGPKVEINPILRTIFKTRGKFIYLFKIIEIILFVYLMWFISTFQDTIPFYILLFYILLYSLLVANNAHIYYKATKKESKTFKVIYLFLILSMLLFIYLNYMLYQDLGTAFEALGKSNQKYNELFYKTEQRPDIEEPKEFDEVLDGLNLTIRR